MLLWAGTSGGSGTVWKPDGGDLLGPEMPVRGGRQATFP